MKFSHGNSVLLACVLSQMAFLSGCLSPEQVRAIQASNEQSRLAEEQEKASRIKALYDEAAAIGRDNVRRLLELVGLYEVVFSSPRYLAGQKLAEADSAMRLYYFDRPEQKGGNIESGFLSASRYLSTVTNHSQATGGDGVMISVAMKEINEIKAALAGAK